MELYVVRHGQTEFNEKKLIMGQLDSKLTQKGKKQAESIGNKLKNIKFDTIYSSTLERAYDTAKIIKSRLEHKPKIKISRDLAEVNYGSLAGKSKTETKKKYPDYHKNVRFINPGGESFEQMEKRVLNFLKNLEPDNSKVLIVTHAGCIRVIYSFFKKEELEKNINMKISNNIIMKYKLENKIPKSIEINKT